MYNLIKPLQAREELLKRNIRIFTRRDFLALFRLTEFQAEYMLTRLQTEGLFVRLKRGVYALKTDPPDEWEIANALYRPSYISFDYALAYYNLIPEMVYQVTSATTKATRLFTTGSQTFGYYTIKQDAYTGYVLKQKGERNLLIATPEKAVVDYLYILSLGKRGVLGKRTTNDRLDLSSLHPEKLRSYAALFSWSALDEALDALLSNKQYDFRRDH
jgi:predicted transcriptional regulator of viral defense system